MASMEWRSPFVRAESLASVTPSRIIRPSFQQQAALARVDKGEQAIHRLAGETFVTVNEEEFEVLVAGKVPVKTSDAEKIKVRHTSYM